MRLHCIALILLLSAMVFHKNSPRQVVLRLVNKFPINSFNNNRFSKKTLLYCTLFRFFFTFFGCFIAFIMPSFRSRRESPLHFRASIFFICLICLSFVLNNTIMQFVSWLELQLKQEKNMKCDSVYKAHGPQTKRTDWGAFSTKTSGSGGLP